jgi:glycosyltransferase involved in cell wall biosynthesis
MSAAAQGGPAVSVLIAVHNGLPYVESALRSVMNQTFRDIEIVVVDDCSTDATPAVLDRLAAEDARIRVLRLEVNHRLPGALNRGLELVRAPLVARMDADDLCHPTRLAVQKRFMDARPQVVVCGTSYRRIDRDGRVVWVHRQPSDAFGTRWNARFNMPLLHPTLMFRLRPQGGPPVAYDPAWSVTEDYDFLVRMLARGEAVCLPDVLLDYRVHGGSITRTRRALMTAQAKEISARHCSAEIGAEAWTALGPFRTAFFDGERTEPAGIFAGIRRLLAADLAPGSGLTPRQRRWVRRLAVSWIWRACNNCGMRSAEIARAFLRHGPDLLPILALRMFETRLWLPPALRSDVDP